VTLNMTCDPEGSYVLLTCTVTANRNGEERKEAKGYFIWPGAKEVELIEEATHYQDGEYDENLSETKRIALTRDELRHIYLEMERRNEPRIRGDAGDDWE